MPTESISPRRRAGALALAGGLLLAGCAAKGPARAAPDLEQTVTVTAAGPVEVPGAPLRLQLAAVNDHRCPSDVRCVWTGHASVALQVWQGPSSPQVVLVGTSAPPAMNLPGTARVGDYRFMLVDLAPAPATTSKPNLRDYRAVIQVARTH